mgnify:FL=1
MTFNKRTNGILLHITSLPSKYGIGTLGEESFKFVDFLKRSEVKIWQLLPLSVTSYGDSPYQSFSTNGLNYYFIDLDELVKQGLLTQKEIDDADLEDENKRKVNYAKQYYNRLPLLKKAFSRFNKNDHKFKKFVDEKEYSDFAFYMTLKNINAGKCWLEFDEKYKTYTPEIENEVISSYHDEYLFYIWTQFEFLNEFKKLKDYANKNGIQIMGDMPIYVALDSVDCYKHPELFAFDEDNRPTLVAGCPPDAFATTGQLWGNPIYNYEYMKEDNFKWFHDRIKYNVKIFDILRIDHFRGFASYYTIKYGAPDAVDGKWVEGPGFDLFKGYTNLPIVAEDLGFLTDDVVKLLKETEFPGMKILEFAYDGDSSNDHKASNSNVNYISYTGTHDNMPLYGYLKTLSGTSLDNFIEGVRNDCSLLNVDFNDTTLKDLTLTTCKLAYASNQICAILPLQDLLTMDNSARMNEPSTLSDKNWSFRFLKSDFTDDVSNFVKENVRRYNR